MFAFLIKVKASMLAGVLVAVPTVANAATAMLASNDYVGISGRSRWLWSQLRYSS